MFESGPHLTFRSGSATEIERYLYEITSYENPEIRCIVTRFLGSLNPNVTPTKPFSSTEIDSEGSELRKVHRLKKRKYKNPGQNYAWHCDGYDKLKAKYNRRYSYANQWRGIQQLSQVKPYGFEIHGCIGGWSRKIMWLYVTRSSNEPNSVAA